MTLTIGKSLALGNAVDDIVKTYKTKLPQLII